MNVTDMFDGSSLKHNVCIPWRDESIIVSAAETQLSNSQVLDVAAGSCHAERTCE